MGFAVSGMFCSLALRMPSQKQDSQRLLLIIEDSVRVMENEGVWFLQCRPKILFQLSIGQKSRNVLIISVLGYGEHRWEGGDVFSAAAQDQRVKCIVSQLAFADGDVLVTGEMNESERASFLSTLNKMAEKKKNTGKEMFVGVTRVLSDNESKVFFEKVKGQYPEMDIKIPFLTVMETLQYKPAESAAKVQCPVLIVIAGQDSVNPPEQGKALYDAVASGTKELYEEADACHYDIYEGAFFERVAAVQTQWFKKHL